MARSWITRNAMAALRAVTSTHNEAPTPSCIPDEPIQRRPVQPMTPPPVVPVVQHLPDEARQQQASLAVRLTQLTSQQRQLVQQLLLFYDEDIPRVVSAISDMLVQGHFNPEQVMVFKDPGALQMLLDAALLVRLPPGKCSALVDLVTSLAVASAANMQFCHRAGMLPRVLVFLWHLAAGDWPDAHRQDSTENQLSGSLMCFLAEMLAQHSTPRMLHTVLAATRASSLPHLRVILGMGHGDEESQPCGASNMPHLHGPCTDNQDFADIVLQVLARGVAINKRQIPRAVFELLGDNAHLEVVGLSSWPPQGYTWLMWYKLASTTSQGKQGQPLKVPLYCIRAASGVAVSCELLEDGALRLRSYHGPHGVLEEMSELTDAFTPGQATVEQSTSSSASANSWRCLSVVHSRTSFFSKGSISVYMDGRIVLESKLRYPSSKDMKGRITMWLGHIPHGRPADVTSASSFQGQIGPVMLFGTPATSGEVSELYYSTHAFPPFCSPCSLRPQLVAAGQGDLPGPPLPTPLAAAPPRLTSARSSQLGLMLALDARHVVDGRARSAVQALPPVRASKSDNIADPETLLAAGCAERAPPPHLERRSEVLAELRGGAAAIPGHGQLSHTWLGAGGGLLLLPLLVLPTHLEAAKQMGWCGRSPALESLHGWTPTPSTFVRVVEVLTRLVEGDGHAGRLHCALLVQYRAWWLMAALIRASPCTFLSGQLLAAVRQLVAVLRQHNPAVAQDAEDTLLMDPGIWKNSAFSVQEELLLGMQAIAAAAGSEGTTPGDGDVPAAVGEMPLAVTACMFWNLPMYCDDLDDPLSCCTVQGEDATGHAGSLAPNERASLQATALQPFCAAMDVMRSAQPRGAGIAGFVSGLAANFTNCALTTDVVRLALLFVGDALAAMEVLRDSEQEEDAAHLACVRTAASKVVGMLMERLQSTGQHHGAFWQVGLKAWYALCWRMILPRNSMEARLRLSHPPHPSHSTSTTAAISDLSLLGMRLLLVLESSTAHLTDNSVAVLQHWLIHCDMNLTVFKAVMPLLCLEREERTRFRAGGSFPAGSAHARARSHRPLASALWPCLLHALRARKSAALRLVALHAIKRHLHHMPSLFTALIAAPGWATELLAGGTSSLKWSSNCEQRSGAWEGWRGRGGAGGMPEFPRTNICNATADLLAQVVHLNADLEERMHAVESLEQMNTEPAAHALVWAAVMLPLESESNEPTTQPINLHERVLQALDNRFPAYAAQYANLQAKEIAAKLIVCSTLAEDDTVSVAALQQSLDCVRIAFTIAQESLIGSKKDSTEPDLENKYQTQGMIEVMYSVLTQTREHLEGVEGVDLKMQQRVLALCCGVVHDLADTETSALAEQPPALAEHRPPLAEQPQWSAQLRPPASCPASRRDPQYALLLADTPWSLHGLLLWGFCHSAQSAAELLASADTHLPPHVTAPSLLRPPHVQRALPAMGALQWFAGHVAARLDATCASGAGAPEGPQDGVGAGAGERHMPCVDSGADPLREVCAHLSKWLEQANMIGDNSLAADAQHCLAEKTNSGQSVDSPMEDHVRLLMRGQVGVWLICWLVGKLIALILGEGSSSRIPALDDLENEWIKVGAAASLTSDQTTQSASPPSHNNRTGGRGDLHSTSMSSIPKGEATTSGSLGEAELQPPVVAHAAQDFEKHTKSDFVRVPRDLAELVQRLVVHAKGVSLSTELKNCQNLEFVDESTASGKLNQKLGGLSAGSTVLVLRSQLTSLAQTPLINQSVTAWDHAADTDRTECEARVHISAAAQSSEQKAKHHRSIRKLAVAEQASTAKVLLDLHRPLLHVRGMKRVWGQSKLTSWLEGSGKADVTGRRGLVQVISVLEEMHIAYGEGTSAGDAPGLGLADSECPPQPPFLKLSSCEGPQRRRARMVPDLCGSQHFEAARNTAPPDPRDLEPGPLCGSSVEVADAVLSHERQEETGDDVLEFTRALTQDAHDSHPHSADATGLADVKDGMDQHDGSAGISSSVTSKPEHVCANVAASAQGETSSCEPAGQGRADVVRSRLLVLGHRIQVEISTLECGWAKSDKDAQSESLTEGQRAAEVGESHGLYLARLATQAQSVSHAMERANSMGGCMAEFANMLPARDPVANATESCRMHASWSAEMEEEESAATGLESTARGGLLGEGATVLEDLFDVEDAAEEGYSLVPPDLSRVGSGLGSTMPTRGRVVGMISQHVRATAKQVVSSARTTAAQVVQSVGSAVQDRAMEGVEMARDVVGAARAAVHSLVVVTDNNLWDSTTASVVKSAVQEGGEAGGAMRDLQAWRVAWGQWRSQVTYLGRAQLVIPRGLVLGTLVVTCTHLFFFGDSLNGADGSGGRRCIRGHSSAETHAHSRRRMLRQRRWALAEVEDVIARRFLMRRSAVELLLVTGRSVFLNFTGQELPAPEFEGGAPMSEPGSSDTGAACGEEAVPEARRQSAENALAEFVRALLSGRLPRMRNHRCLRRKSVIPPRELMRTTGWTEAWRHHQISNYEYLMHLNSAGGRSFQDLSQYPIFPWIIQDYTSTTLDLKDPSTYRDLSRPMGALGEERLARLLTRYHQMKEDDSMPAFMYGSHYSNPGSVIFFLIRMPPFCCAALDLQGGKFDFADRLFHSVAEAYHNCTHSDSDLKELTPEFFSCPDFLRNDSAHLPLGTRQDGTSLGDVALPPWANNSADEFVKINSEALESDHVSANLHHWIDLIFGFKQRGLEAEKACNVFHYLTYEGALDPREITDPVLRLAVETQVSNFGQVPMQIFKQAHPPRLPADSSAPSVSVQSSARLLVEARSSMERPGTGAAPRRDVKCSSTPLTHSLDLTSEAVPGGIDSTSLPKAPAKLHAQTNIDSAHSHTHPPPHPSIMLVEPRSRSPGAASVQVFSRLFVDSTLNLVHVVHGSTGDVSTWKWKRKLVGSSSLMDADSHSMLEDMVGYAGARAHSDLISSLQDPSAPVGCENWGFVRFKPLMTHTNAVPFGVSKCMGVVRNAVGQDLHAVPVVGYLSPGARQASAYSASKNEASVSRRRAKQGVGVVVSAGGWDGSIAIIPLGDGARGLRQQSAVMPMGDVPLCVAVSEGGEYIAAGSAAGSVCVWPVADVPAGGRSRGGLLLSESEEDPVVLMGQGDDPWAAGSTGVTNFISNPILQPKNGAWRVLWGHLSGVICVSVAASWDTVVSGGLDGTCIMHSLLKGRPLHRLGPKPGTFPSNTFAGDQTVHKVATLPMVAGVSVSIQTGEMVVHTVSHPDDKRAGIKAVLAVYSHNAALRTSANLRGSLHTIQVSKFGRCILCAGLLDGVHVRALDSLQVVMVLHPPGPYAVYQPILASVRRGPLQRAYVGGVVSAAFSPDETAALGLTSLGAILCYRIPL